MEQKNKTSIFWKVFGWIIFISLFSNILLSYTIYNGYRGFLWQVNSYLPKVLVWEINLGLKKTWLVVVIFLLVIIILNLVFVVVLISGILGPLKKILNGIKEVGKGNLNIQLNIKTNDELETLAEGFNQMVKEIKKTKEALEEEKSVLEIKVAARTRALKELAETLELQVQERTKELRQRLEELEKFHKITLGRELKIIELKEEIRRLKEELEKKSEK